VTRVTAQLAADKREWDKRKRAEARKEQEKEKFEKMRVEEEAREAERKVERKVLEAKKEEETRDKEARKKEAVRMQEDARVAVRVKPLGQDRHHRTYWWGVGAIKAAVYVEDTQGMWGILSTRKEVDALFDALHLWGTKVGL
jgi:hypothetical protein